MIGLGITSASGFLIKRVLILSTKVKNFFPSTETDHGRPNNHTNPHQHRWEKNPIGGYPLRDDAEPLPR